MAFLKNANAAQTTVKPSVFVNCIEHEIRNFQFY